MAPKPAGNETHGRSLNRFTTVILIGYVAFIAALMLLRRATLSPEVFVVFAGRDRGDARPRPGLRARLGAVPAHLPGLAAGQIPGR